MKQYCCHCLPNRSQNFNAPSINNLTNYDIERVGDIKHGKIEKYHSFVRSKFNDSKILNRRYRCGRGLRVVSAAARVLGLRVLIPSGEWMFVTCGYCVLSSRRFCDGPIPRPEESYRVCVNKGNNNLFTCNAQADMGLD